MTITITPWISGERSISEFFDLLPGKVEEMRLVLRSCEHEEPFSYLAAQFYHGR